VHLFPLPDPPADVVADVLDELRSARRELTDAQRLVHMLALPFPGDGDELRRVGRLRLQIEQTVAEHRAGLWAAEVARIEARGRALGLDVTPAL
jgi:hypothetical protein